MKHSRFNQIGLEKDRKNTVYASLKKIPNFDQRVELTTPIRTSTVTICGKKIPFRVSKLPYHSLTYYPTIEIVLKVCTSP